MQRSVATSTQPVGHDGGHMGVSGNVLIREKKAG